MDAIADAEARHDLGAALIGAAVHALGLHVEDGVEERLLIIGVEAGGVERLLLLLGLLVLRLAVALLELPRVLPLELAGVPLELAGVLARVTGVALLSLELALHLAHRLLGLGLGSAKQILQRIEKTHRELRDVKWRWRLS